MARWASRAPHVVRPSSKSTHEPPSIIICTSSSRSSCEYPLAATFFQKSRNSAHVMLPFPSSSTSAKPGCRGVAVQIHLVEKRLELRLQGVGKRALALGEGVRQPCLVNLLSTAAADDDRLGREHRPLHGTLLHNAVEGDPSVTLGLAHLLALLEQDLCDVPERVLRARERQSDGDRASKRRFARPRAEQDISRG